MLLPRHFVHKANFLARGEIGPAVSVENVRCFSGIEVGHRLFEQFVKDLGLGRLVDAVPIHVFRRFAARIQDNPPILRRPSRVFASVDGKGIAVLGAGDDALLVVLFVLEQFGVRQVAVERARSGNAQGRRQARLRTRVRPRHGASHSVGVTARRVKRQRRSGSSALKHHASW